MAVYRTIQLSFWTDSKVIDEFTPEDKYFYLYLMTNPHTNMCGCYELSTKAASDDTGYTKDTIERLIDRFVKIHKVICYSKETKEVLIVNWSRYNWTESPKFRVALLENIEKVKNAEFKAFLMGLFNGNDTVSIPYTYPTDTSVLCSCSYSVNKDKGVKGEKKKDKPVKNKYGSQENVLLTDEEYERLKKKYPDCIEDAIEYLSLYIAEKKYKSESHNLAIQRWVIDAVRKKKPANSSFELKV